MSKSLSSLPESIDSNTNIAKKDQVLKLAKWQRLLIISFFISVACSLIPRTGLFFPADGIIVGVGVAFFQLWCIISICEYLSMKTESWLYFIGIFIPYVDLVVIAVLSWKAISYIRSSGVKVGILGAKIL